MNQALQRIEKNAQALMEQYKTSAQLLNVAVKGAMPWAAPLAMNGVIPHLSQIEQLATQLIAIVMASEPKEAIPQERPAWNPEWKS